MRIFEKDPEKRIDIYDLINDPWVTDDGQNVIDLDMSQDTDSVGSRGQLSSDGELRGSVNGDL